MKVISKTWAIVLAVLMVAALVPMSVSAAPRYDETFKWGVIRDETNTTYSGSNSDNWRWGQVDSTNTPARGAADAGWTWGVLRDDTNTTYSGTDANSWRWGTMEDGPRGPYIPDDDAWRWGMLRTDYR